MSIQPHRVIDRIVRQVDRSDWPPLVARLLVSADGDEILRVYDAPIDPARYATPIHFWVHALRDELAACDRRADLVGAAGHALCRHRTVADWLEELDRLAIGSGRRAVDVLGLRRLDKQSGRPVEAYAMLESECRCSSVVGNGERWWAHFWGHGGVPSWRRRGRR